MKVFIVLMPFLFCGCCWLAKRDCFPACPPETVVTVEKPCSFPPVPPPLNAVTLETGCPKDAVCFDKATAAQIAKHIGDLKQWISFVKSNCGSTPSSRSSTLPSNK